MFDSLPGNKKTLETLSRLLENSRFPQSSIFSGPAGIGKEKVALWCAQSLVCQTSKIACGTCRACIHAKVFSLPTSGKKKDYEMVYFSEQPDVGKVVSNKQNIYVEAIRDLEREANFRPFEARNRVFLINDADKMSPAAENALLKTLEEPTETSYIILITSSISALFATIRSRCQIIRFAPPSTESTIQMLLETKRYSPADAKLVAQIAAGNPELAQSFVPDELRKERDDFLRIVEAGSRVKTAAEKMQIAAEFSNASSSADYSEKLLRFQDVLRGIWLISLGNGTQFQDYEDFPRLAATAKLFSTKQIAGWIEDVSDLRFQLKFNLNRKIASDALAVKIGRG
ncbi:MAG: ATP-binding protein [Pyrinomonadaceae bacterium]